MGSIAFELALADEKVELARHRIVRQEERIARLSSGGHPIALAEDLLGSFEHALANCLTHRDRIWWDASRTPGR